MPNHDNDDVTDVLEVHAMKEQTPWHHRPSVHQTIANEIFGNLTDTYASGYHSQIAFQVLVYIPYPKNTPEQHCLVQDKNDSFVEGNRKHGVDYVVHYYMNSSELNTCLDRLWRKIEGKGPEILNAAFSMRTKNMCQKADEKIRDVEAASTDTHCGFSGVAAVRCAYEFVWYQLAYRYFTVGRSAGARFELSTNDTAYERKCGQVFPFA